MLGLVVAFSPGVEQLRDGSTESFWQSDGPQLLGTKLMNCYGWWWIHPRNLTYQQLPCLKGVTFSNPSFWVSTLVFGGVPGSLIFQPLSWLLDLATFILSKDFGGHRHLSFSCQLSKFCDDKQKSWGLISSTSSFNGRHRCYVFFLSGWGAWWHDRWRSARSASLFVSR